MSVSGRTRGWVAIGISIGAVLFTGLNFMVSTLTNLPDVKYYYTISRDLNFKEGFNSFPEIKNRHIIQSRYYKSIKGRETELEPGTLFLWLVICNEGEGRTRYCYLETVTYRFKNQPVNFNDARNPTRLHDYEYKKYELLPHSIYPRTEPRSVVVLLCEHFVLSKEKDPEQFIKENMGFRQFAVEARTRGIIPLLPFRASSKTNYATKMWPYPD